MKSDKLDILIKRHEFVVVNTYDGIDYEILYKGMNRAKAENKLYSMGELTSIFINGNEFKRNEL